MAIYKKVNNMLADVSKERSDTGYMSDYEVKLRRLDNHINSLCSHIYPNTFVLSCLSCIIEINEIQTSIRKSFSDIRKNYFYDYIDVFDVLAVRIDYESSDIFFDSDHFDDSNYSGYPRELHAYIEKCIRKCDYPISLGDLKREMFNRIEYLNVNIEELGRIVESNISHSHYEILDAMLSIQYDTEESCLRNYKSMLENISPKDVDKWIRDRKESLAGSLQFTSFLRDKARSIAIEKNLLEPNMDCFRDALLYFVNVTDGNILSFDSETIVKYMFREGISGSNFSLFAHTIFRYNALYRIIVSIKGKPDLSIDDLLRFCCPKTKIASVTSETNHNQFVSNIPTNFQNLILDQSKADLIIAKMKELIGDKKCKDAIAVIFAAYKLGLISNPSYSACKEEFPSIGGSSNFYDYMNGRKSFNNALIKGYTDILSKL